jgi:hypothetical protein
MRDIRGSQNFWLRQRNRSNGYFSSVWLRLDYPFEGKVLLSRGALASPFAPTPLSPLFRGLPVLIDKGNARL